MASFRRVIEDDFIALEARKLLLGSRLTFDVFSDEDKKSVTLFSKGDIFGPDNMHFLLRTGIETVYVRSHERGALDVYLSQNSKTSRATSFYNNPVEFRKATFFKEQYYQIDKSVLKPGTKIDFSLYIMQGVNFSILATASEEEPLAVDEALLRDERDILIRKADMPLYRQYMSRIDEGKVTDHSLLLKERSKIAIKELLENPANEEKIKEVSGTVENMIGQIFDNSNVLSIMMPMRNISYYVYSHSINVAVFSLALGAATGMSKDILLKLGIGAIFHDVGMSAISPEIVNKQGQLTYQEYAILKAHVTEGERILKLHENIPEESVKAVLQHHEKLSGKGYPYKIKGDDIKPFGRVIAIADCFDSLITTCPYRPAFAPFAALSIMAKDKEYDADLLRSFIRMLGKSGKSLAK